MTTIAQVRAALKTAVETVSGLSGAAYIQDTINAPVAHIVPLEFDPRLVLSKAKSVYNFQIRVYAPRAAVEDSQTLLDGYREVSGSTSITAAVESAAGLTAITDYAEVIRIGEVQVVEIAGIPYLYLEIDLEVCW